MTIQQETRYLAYLEGRPFVGRSGEFLFVDQSNFFLNNYADRQPSSRNTHQEYSFHLYSGGTSPPKAPCLHVEDVF